MQGLLETPGLTVAGHLVHGQVNEAPEFVHKITHPTETESYCKT